MCLKTVKMEDKESIKTEIMNLIGYGLAKFDVAYAHEFGCKSKSEFCRYIIQIGLAKTERAVMNRQDSFDPYFDNGRRGWFQRNQREHIKLFIDSLFGDEDVHGYANTTKLYIQSFYTNINFVPRTVSPIVKSKFKNLQETGKEAEFYFMNNYTNIPLFENGSLEDARLWGDGYDFQIKINDKFLLTEVKGIREKKGMIRMTQNEYDKATEYANDYCLVVVSNLNFTPRLDCVFNPIQNLDFTCKQTSSIQNSYHSMFIP